MGSKKNDKIILVGANVNFTRPSSHPFNCQTIILMLNIYMPPNYYSFILRGKTKEKTFRIKPIL